MYVWLVWLDWGVAPVDFGVDCFCAMDCILVVWLLVCWLCLFWILGFEFCV